MYKLRTKCAKRDPIKRWALPDRVFFACGACHILAYAFLRTYPEILHRVLSFFPERIYIEEQLQHGDSRAAIVVCTAPLLVAAYSDELDCIAMLRFPNTFAEEYKLWVGSRLLTVNTYGRGQKYDEDLILGPNLIER